MDTTQTTELVMGGIMVFALIIVAIRLSRGKPLSARMIQFVSIVFLIPTIVILSIEGIIKSDIVGTLLGAIAGYVLSGIGDFDKNRKPKDKNTIKPIQKIN